jgi:RNA polymerase sigma-70 factor (sigma-E family)
MAGWLEKIPRSRDATFWPRRRLYVVAGDSRSDFASARVVSREADLMLGTDREVVITALYAATWHRLVRLALLLVDDVPSAEDLVQDAFVGLHRHRSALRSEDAAEAYVRAAVINGSRSLLRKRRVARNRKRVIESPTRDAADHSLLVAAQEHELVQALRLLPSRQREVLVLRYWAGLDLAAIASTLGISVGTVKSTSSRGLDALHQRLGARR